MKPFTIFLLSCAFAFMHARADDTLFPAVTINNVTYKNVRVVRSTLQEVMLRTDTGFIKATLSDLPPEIQKHVGDQVADQLKNELQNDAAAKTAKLKQLEQTREHLLRYRPYRIIDDTLYDFTEVIRALRNNDLDDTPIPLALHRYFIRGKVMQILKDGVLVWDKDRAEKVLFVNYGFTDRIVDGSTVRSAGKYIGRYQYQTVLGAEATIDKFDCGIEYDPAIHKNVDTSYRISLTRGVYRTPVPNLNYIPPELAQTNLINLPQKQPKKPK